MASFTAEYASVIWVTLIYIGLYYAFMINGMLAKLRVAKRCKESGEPFLRYTQHYPEILAADRVQLNTLEHMPPFLVLMWLQAFMVSTYSATILGAIYVFIRATYPFFMGKAIHRSFPKRIFINTFSGYAVLTIFAGCQLYALVSMYL